MNTTGFKRHRAEFQDLLYQNLWRVGSASSDAGTIVPTGVQLGLGVKSAAIYRISGQGNIMQTENPLDPAINGRGFLMVELPPGETAYTRAGSLQLSPHGHTVTSYGTAVHPRTQVPNVPLSHPDDPSRPADVDTDATEAPA